jgi:hypothetical protein
VSDTITVTDTSVEVVTVAEQGPAGVGFQVPSFPTDEGKAPVARAAAGATLYSLEAIATSGVIDDAIAAHVAEADPHPDYALEVDVTTSLSGKADATHAHAIADTTGLQAALDGKQASGSYAAATHSHAISDTTGLQAALDGKASSTHDHDAAYAAIGHDHAGVYQAAGSYAAAVHTHAIADTTGLQTALDGKASTSHDHSGVYQPAGSYADATHSHATSDVTGLDTALAGKEASGTAASLIAVHEAASNPHPTYLTQAEGDALYAALGSAGSGDMAKATYDPDDDGKVVSALAADAAPWAGITGKPSTFPPETHAHDDLYYTETEVDSALALKASSTHDHDADYAALTHSHAIADVTGLQTALDGKQAAGSYAAASHTHAWADVTGEPTTLAGYGITDAASSTHNHDATYAALSHTHTASQVTDFNTAVDVRVKFPPVAASFTAAGDAYMPIHEAMTLNVAGKVEAGVGTFTIAKAVAATPTSFSTITTSTTFVAGDVLKITAASVTGYCAVTLPRTA